MSRAPRTTLPLGLVALGAALLTWGCQPPPPDGARRASPVPRSAAASPSFATPARPSAPVPEPPAGLQAYDPGEDGRLSLREFYEQKHPEEERLRVRETLQRVLALAEAEELDEATEEILAFHHLVYHRTRFHDLEKNHAVARLVESRLRDLADRHGVPLLPVLGIVSWENSGDLGKVSWANAAGLGQMTWGAVERAHSFAAEEAGRLKEEAAGLRSQGTPEAQARAEALEARAAGLDVARRHRLLAREAAVRDERLLVEANLEDAVLFFKFLLEAYGGRADLAISAYHNGLLNNDDLLLDYLVRQGETLPHPQEERAPFLEALARRDVSFLDLWRDPRSREMLNGLRTVEGEPTRAGNAHLALGDESDLYPWKVLASLAGLEAGPEFTARMVARYGDRWDLVEVRGLPEYRSLSALEESASRKHLVPLPRPVRDLGISGRVRPDSPVRPLSYFATPELAGYLADLEDRLARSLGKRGVRLPVANLLGAGVLEGAPTACAEGDTRTHLRGVAVDLVPKALEPGARRALEALLNADWVMDRVYLDREPGRVHLVLNPRRGEQFEASYQRALAGSPEPR